MADPFHHEDLTSLFNRRATAQLYVGIKHLLEAGDREPITVLSALAAAFITVANQCDVDPLDGLSQIWEAMERQQFSLKDDPARGQFIHPMGRA